MEDGYATMHVSVHMISDIIPWVLDHGGFIPFFGSVFLADSFLE